MGDFFLHINGAIVQKSTLKIAICFFTLSTVVHVGAVTTKSVLVKSLCEAMLVALKQSEPQAYSLWVSKFNTDRFIRDMRPLEIVVIFHFQ